jgi:nucleoside-diphosphate kinase
MEKVGAKMRAFYLELGYDQGEEELLKLSDQDLGSLVETWSKDYLMEGKIVAMVWSGYQAVATIRKMVGSTFPNEALPGTIRGDFSMDSSAASSSAKRSTRNIVHASGNLEEARQEIELWFKNNEICLD